MATVAHLPEDHADNEYIIKTVIHSTQSVVVTFRRDVDEHGVAEFSEIFPGEHLAPDPHLVVDVGLEPVQVAVRAPHQVHLR